MKARYDLKTIKYQSEKGSKVCLFNSRRKKGRSPKLRKSLEGLYKVLKKFNNIVYISQKMPCFKMKGVHIDSLDGLKDMQEYSITHFLENIFPFFLCILK